jgi:hypothetical protein
VHLLATAIEEGRGLSSMSGVLADTACRLLLDACQHVEAESAGSEQVGAGYAVQAFLIAEHLC